MKEIHYFYVPGGGELCELPVEEARHAIKVLRLTEGDRIVITDGRGYFYDAEVSCVSSRSCEYSILNKRKAESPWQGHLHLAVAPTKNMDRTEWLVEKAVEIGLDEISFVDCRFSERKVLKPERIERIVVSAMKQSHKAKMPKVNPLVPFKDFIARPDIWGEKYIAHCLNEEVCGELSGKPAADSPRCFLPAVMGNDSKIVLIGPEGDFALEEVEQAIANDFIPVSLGESRLRTETAALYSVMLMNLKNSKLSEAFK